jgi:hypothetical protein
VSSATTSLTLCAAKSLMESGFASSLDFGAFGDEVKGCAGRASFWRALDFASERPKPLT